jgi:hypothetical protein
MKRYHYHSVLDYAPKIAENSRISQSAAAFVARRNLM